MSIGGTKSLDVGWVGGGRFKKMSMCIDLVAEGVGHSAGLSPWNVSGIF